MNRTQLKWLSTGLFVVVAVCLSLTAMFLLGMVVNSYQALPVSDEAIVPGTGEPEALATSKTITATPQMVELVFDGKGTQEIRFIVEHSGVYVFATNHTGDGAFVIVIKDANDQLVETAANCEDDCADYRVVTLDVGEYIMQIEAQGWWLIIAQLISP